MTTPDWIIKGRGVEIGWLDGKPWANEKGWRVIHAFMDNHGKVPDPFHQHMHDPTEAPLPWAHMGRAILEEYAEEVGPVPHAQPLPPGAVG